MEEQKTTNIYEAILNVMREVKNIDKEMTVGDGKNAYKAVSDKDVKFKIGQSMAKNNLICLPIKICPTKTIDRWEENTQYGNKMKQSVFVEVETTYKIIHTITQESVEIVGYGHGIDPQDKAAGKATTYALKNALLYTFLVPTGSIDDTDNEHSDKQPTPPQPTKNYEQLINNCKTQDELKSLWLSMPTAEKTRLAQLKENKKNNLK